MTESKLRHIIKEVIREELTSNEQEQVNLPHSSDIFNLDSIPMDILDNGYVRYHPYTLGIPYRHPLRKITEDVDYKQNIKEVKDVITSTFPISDKQFIIKEGHNGMYAAILVSLVEDNVEIIEKAMNKLGYFRSNPTDERLLCDKKNRKWIDLRFEPIKSNDLIDESDERDRIWAEYANNISEIEKNINIINYFVYLKDDELINEFPIETIHILQDAIAIVERLLGENEYSDKEIFRYNNCLEEGYRVLNTSSILAPLNIGV